LIKGVLSQFGCCPPDICIYQHNLNIQNDLYTSFNSWGFGVLGIYQFSKNM
jgi:hypothetical protein